MSEYDPRSHLCCNDLTDEEAAYVTDIILTARKRNLSLEAEPFKLPPANVLLAHVAARRESNRVREQKRNMRSRKRRGH